VLGKDPKEDLLNLNIRTQRLNKMIFGRFKRIHVLADNPGLLQARDLQAYQQLH
jgi:hypothetical protein